VKSQPRKTITHEHLSTLDLAELNRLQLLLTPIVEQALNAVTSGLPQNFGQCLTRYAQVLADHGLECEESRRDRDFFMSLPEVIGAKGSGARLSDSMVVMFSRRPQQETLDRIAERGLKLVTWGLPAEFGLRS
jgi:hypothetical protein